MSSSSRDVTGHQNPIDEDDPMLGVAEEEEEEPQPGANLSLDSSEEEEEDEDEERRIREGFIVDEDEDEEAEEEDANDRKRRRKRRKRRHRRDEEGEDLEEDDIALLQENTGTDFSHRLTRLRRGRASTSPAPAASSSKHKAVVPSSDEDDLDNDGTAHDIANIWDDDRAGRADEDEDMDLDDMDNFIEYEDDEMDGTGVMDEAQREEKRRERRRMEKERRKALGNRPELSGIDANAWDEIHQVFGDGSDYAWALEDDNEYDEEIQQQKLDMKYTDVFEPSEIRARMLTEDDDLIRAQDTPERMQLATSSLSLTNVTLATRYEWQEEDLDDAAPWVLTRLSPSKDREFLQSSGRSHKYLQDLVEAIKFSLRCLFMLEFEVPYIYTYKRDYITYFNPEDMRTKLDLLSQDELWRIYSLGQKYSSFLERRAAVDVFYGKLATKDPYFETELRRKLGSVEMVADATEWLGMKYPKSADKGKAPVELRFHDDVEEQEPVLKKHQRPSRVSAYEVAKKSIVAKLAEGFGIGSQHIVSNFSSHRMHDVEDPDLNPVAFADQFVDPDPAKAQPPEELLRRARMIIATELGKDPLLRQAIRDAFKTDALISVTPTERGVAKIDEHNQYYNFKYLYNKPIAEMLETPQFLNILAAEHEHLVMVSITLHSDAFARFERKLGEAFESSSYSETAKAWNEERSRVVQEALEGHLIPVGVKWIREWLRDEVEDWLSKRCAAELRNRIDVMPYVTPSTQPGDTPSVLAISWGKGDPQKDAITMVFLDEAGRFREHMKIDNLVDEATKDQFKDIVQRRRPDVIAIGGFSLSTTKLSQRVKETVGRKQLTEQPQSWDSEPSQSSPEGELNVPVIYAQDEVARIFQHSKRAEEEFGALSTIARYCVGLARYVQSPLNEYAALGSDITAISFDEDCQQLLPHEKLLFALERVLVDLANKVGVDINRAITDSYYQRLLPLVCGLGPRKSQMLVKKIAAMGGTVVNREAFIKSSLLTTKIFLNSAGFLRIVSDTTPMTKHSKNRQMEDAEVSDPLDNTRIHPEDYELARKMATDALELDEEDIHDEHPSHVVSTIMRDEDNERKLNELNLDDFAVSLFETNQDKKRYTLFDIRREILKPYGDLRKPYRLPASWDVLTMLTGETPRTLRTGLIVSVLVVRSLKRDKSSGGGAVAVRLNSGIEGIIEKGYMADTLGVDADELFPKGRTIPAVVFHVEMVPETDSFWVRLSARPSDVAQGDSQYRRVRPDEYWDHSQHERDTDVQKRKKRAEANQTRRVIKHPNFHNFNSSQAEAYLDKQQRGDVVIRPSSKGQDHLAVTWKVDDKLYQHIDVTEPNADVTGQSLGNRFFVEGGKEYSDLDELIVNHVQTIARRVEELMAHEKFKAGPEDELHLFLKNFVKANPSKSAYGFTLNRRKPGHFNLCFLANKSSAVQTWPVRVAPEAYYLFDAPAPGVPELCDAFKVRHLNESQNKALGGGVTPYPGRTPARTPGHVTPGHASVRHPARTPNPYGGQQPHPSSTPYNNAPPYGAPPPNQYGYQTPGYPPARTPAHPGTQPLPAGMNPQRAAMLQSTGGWGATNSGGWGS